MAKARVVVLGAGFGGLEVSTRLSEELGDDADVVLLDRSDGFVFGFSKLDVMFGKKAADAVHHAYADLVRPGVRFVQADIRSIDPAAKRVESDAGTFEGDVLVVALGADLDPAGTPGLVEDDRAHEFYSEAGAFGLRDVLAGFEGGRAVVAVTSTPFKCPPAPSETALLLHDHLVANGGREGSEIHVVMPMPVPIPPAPEASKVVLSSFAERGIEWHGSTVVERLDPDRHVALLAGGEELPYDLFLGVPRHRAPQVVVDAGLTVDGWIPVDPATLETAFPGVYAAGDVTSVGTPKAGAFAEGQAAVIADRILESVRGEVPSTTYGGVGTCYLEFGSGRVSRVSVTFRPGEAPFGTFTAPTPEQAAEKVVFGTSRIARWFGGEAGAGSSG